MFHEGVIVTSFLYPFNLVLALIVIRLYIYLMVTRMAKPETESEKMTNQFPAEVIEVVTGAARMMIEDGVTVDQFKSDIERMTRVYIESYIERQRKMCMDYLTSTTTRDAALNILLGMMKAQ